MITKVLLVTALSGIGGCSTLSEYIQVFFAPEDHVLMERIARCESSADPDDEYSLAVNHKSGATGWFQHLPKWWDERSKKAGYEGAHILNPEANVAVASYLYYHLDGNERWGGASHWYPSRRCWGGI